MGEGEALGSREFSLWVLATSLHGGGGNRKEVAKNQVSAELNE